jgi:hypothetical protein
LKIKESWRIFSKLAYAEPHFSEKIVKSANECRSCYQGTVLLTYVILSYYVFIPKIPSGFWQDLVDLDMVKEIIFFKKSNVKNRKKQL